MSGGRPPGKVAGVGINDMPGWCALHKDGKNLLEYRTYDLWKSMLKRTCNEKYKEQKPVYKDCTVCERWLRLSNFAEDIQQLPGYEMWRDNPGKRVSLDKDTRVPGNKHYSLETCCFLTIADSVRDVTKRHFRAECGEDYIQRSGLPAPKKIVCEFPDGSTREFPSAGAAARAGLGFARRNVALCCEGYVKTHKGCKFYYA